MKKLYISPTINIKSFSLEHDILVCSGGGKPGHGYGDKGGGHTGPPGHNKFSDGYWDTENLWD